MMWLVQPVDDGDRLPIPDALDPRTQQVESLRGQVPHHRREFEPALEPRAHLVAVGRRHVDARPRGRKRRDMPRDHQFRIRIQHVRLREPPPSERPHDRRRRAERQHLPPAQRPARRFGLLRTLDFAQDRLPQPLRRRFPQRRRPQRGSHRHPLPVQRGAPGARREVPHHLGGRHRIELVVDVGVQHPQGQRAVHRRDTLWANSIRCCRRSRPRESRDMTVPMGMSTMALISL